MTWYKKQCSRFTYADFPLHFGMICDVWDWCSKIILTKHNRCPGEAIQSNIQQIAKTFRIMDRLRDQTVRFTSVTNVVKHSLPNGAWNCILSTTQASTRTSVMSAVKVSSRNATTRNTCEDMMSEVIDVLFIPDKGKCQGFRNGSQKRSWSPYSLVAAPLRVFVNLDFL